MDKFVYTAHRSFLTLAIKGINFIPIIGLTEEIQNVYRVHVQQYLTYQTIKEIRYMSFGHCHKQVSDIVSI